MPKEYSFSSMGFSRPSPAPVGDYPEIKSVRLKGSNNRVMTFAQMEQHAEEVRLIHAQLHEETVTFL